MDIRNNEYYATAKKGSSGNHPSNELIHWYGERATKILDLGCGEGTRLASINNSKAEKIGVDASPIAIKIARKQYPSLKFIQAGSHLPFPDNYFDFVYSAFVLEHLEDPEQFLKEAVRVLSIGGKILLTAPNFGSPNRASPNNTVPRATKLLSGIKNDLLLIGKNDPDKLDWQKVKPQKKYKEIDADTTIEPYLLTLEKFLVRLKIKKIKSSSLWNVEKKTSFFQFLFSVLGKTGIYPFIYWGPHILYIGEKNA